ncbi:MAG: MAPEG family protein [Pseudomonadota bacterium]
MTPELTVLALAALLQYIQFVLMSVPLNLQLGPKATAGPRDEALEIKGIPGRLFRAFNNHFEALILFTIAVIVVTLSDQSTPYTAACAWTYLIARILYIPAYAIGVPFLRTLIFVVGFAATLAMILSALI